MTKKIYFENLDGLRFLCFLSVFFFHSFHTELESVKSTDLYHFVRIDIFGNGNLGVNFFFVLSGFLITYLLIEEKKLNGQIDIKKFWLRRVLRIWPLFYFCVFFGFYAFPALKSAFGQVPNETASIGYYLTFTNNFNFLNAGLPDSSVLAVLWSVAVEEQFYLVWPIVLYLLPVRKYWIAFSITILISLLFRIFNTNFYVREHHTLSCIGDMAIGAFGAWLISTNMSFKQKIQNMKTTHISIVYVLFLLAFVFRDDILNCDYFVLKVVERSVIAVVILMIILEQCFAENSFYKMSNFKLFSKLGTISYGLYCLHTIGILTVTNLTKHFHFNTELWQIFILETILALVLTIIISAISYKFYERPFLKLKDRFSYFTK